MQIFLFVASILAFLAGVGILAEAKSAIHEIEAFLFFLISSVLFTGAAIIDAVLKLRKSLSTFVARSSMAGENAEASPSLEQRMPPSRSTAIHLSATDAAAALKKIYFYSTGKDNIGPFSPGEILQLLKTGVVNYQTPMFKEGDTEWKRLAEFEEIFASSQG